MASENSPKRRTRNRKGRVLAANADEFLAPQSSLATIHPNQTFNSVAPSENRSSTISKRLAQSSISLSEQQILPLSHIETSLQSLNLQVGLPKKSNFGKPSAKAPSHNIFDSPTPLQQTRASHSLKHTSASRRRPVSLTSETGTETDSELDSYSDSSSSESERGFPSRRKGYQMAMGRNQLSKAATEEARLEKFQLGLLNTGYLEQDTQQIRGTPIFAHGVLKTHPDAFTQYGFLAGDTTILGSSHRDKKIDPRLYFNIAAPSSVFICGSQGSGKSHSLSCLLENCLVKSDVNKLVNPLAGLVFHYDTFTSDIKGIPCEAAHLASDPNIKVKILCSPANVETIKRTYAGMNVEIEPLRIDQRDLDTKRMLDLMAVNPENGPMPLYLHAINRILREMRIQQQADGVDAHFKYAIFKQKLDGESMTPAQLMPLQQRLDTLESFMHTSQIGMRSGQNVQSKTAESFKGNDWSLKAGTLTIVDLSCPCVTPEGACALFNICLGIFMGQKEKIGRVVALDEAHKYMGSANEASILTNTLLSAIRLQRHLGTRVFISTQEPTISPKLLDLCSVTIVHRFQSPEWLRCLKAHLAALDDVVNEDGKRDLNAVFQKIVKLRVGEALLFAPSATVNGDGGFGTKRLGMDYLRVRVRSRITHDGGKSVMAA